MCMVIRVTLRSLPSTLSDWRGLAFSQASQLPQETAFQGGDGGDRSFRGLATFLQAKKKTLNFKVFF